MEKSKKGRVLYQIVTPVTQYDDEYYFSIQNKMSAVNDQLYRSKEEAEEASKKYVREAASDIINEPEDWVPNEDIYDPDDPEMVAFLEAFNLDPDGDEDHIEFLKQLRPRMDRDAEDPLSEAQIKAVAGLCSMLRVEIVELEIVG